MKQFFVHLALFAIILPVYSQNKFTLSGNNTNLPNNDRWDLDKYVWSHTHYKNRNDDKPVIDFDALDNWIGIGSDYDLSISPNGKYFAYGLKVIVLNQRDSFVVQSIDNAWRKSFAGVKIKPGFFSGDSKQYIFQDKEGLYFLRNGGDEFRYIKEVASYKLISKSRTNGVNTWLAYQLKSKEVVLQNLFSGEEKRIANVISYDFDKNGQQLACRLNNANNELLIYNLATGAKKRFQWVTGYIFAQSGKAVLLKTVEKVKDITTIELKYMSLTDGAIQKIWSNADKNIVLSSYTLDKSGNQVMFEVQDNNDKQSGYGIWYWRKEMDSGVVKVNNQTVGINGNLIIQGSASFTYDNEYIQFKLQPKPDLRQVNPDAVKVDVWSYKDTVLQSSQPYLLKEQVAYTAILNLRNGKVIQLGRGYCTIAGDFAIIIETPTSDRFWEKGNDINQYWIVSLKDGNRQLLPAKKPIGLNLSSNGNYLIYFDTVGGGNYFSYNLNAGKLVVISGGRAFGHLGYRDCYLLTKEKLPDIHLSGLQTIGWVDDDSGFLVSDNYDIWKLDPSGKKSPVNITNGYGRLHYTEFWISDREKRYFSSKDTILLGAFDHKNRFNGFYRKILGTFGNPEQVFMGPYFFMQGGVGIHGFSKGMAPLKAVNANVWIVQKQSITEAPNYFVTIDFKNYKPLTNLQLHKKYNWLTADLHHFKQLDGTLSQGILYKPENFTPSKKYPVIIPFYTQWSDQLYQYPTPEYINAPDFSDNPAWMVSHGYLVFVPDIYFTKGKWGPSTVNAIDGAAKYLKSLPYVDGQHLAACGHSNSGRFGYYLLTHSHSFAAMSVGSGHGGTDYLSIALSIDETNGESELEWAERSAYGAGGLGNLWQNKSLWLDHIAVLQADKVKCPLLLFHNKKDGDDVRLAAELFIALRRLEKPVWWLQYDEGTHRVEILRDKKDFTIRTTQFYDHYLKRAPAPRWMKDGLPYRFKGIESRYELNLNDNLAH